MDISEVRKSVEESLAKMDELIENLKKERDSIKKEIEKKIEELQFGKFNKEEIEKFLEEPYVIIPKRENEFYVISPRWVDFQIGWLERQTKSYNIFVVNKYMQWITPIPESLRKKLKFPEPLPLKVYDGMLLTGEHFQERAWNKYRKHLSARYGKDRIRIKRGHEFKLIANLIEDGILPFIPKAVDQNDLREWNGIKLRSYQKEAWKEFLDKGACGIYWAFGSGKSFFGIYALARIKGKKLVVVPTLTLKEQWLERIEKFIPEYKYEIEVETYHSYYKLRDKEYSLIIFDECQHLPANTFIRLATLKTKYRLGFSGSPFREDKRENYIFALTGFPIGMAWDELLKLQVVRKPTFKLYLLPDNKAKIRKLNELLKLPLKTIIFCDSIEFGQRIARNFNIPFIYGATRDRLEIIRNSDICVVSRVGDEGISLPDIERVIEVSFLFGSRMQESQRFGRLMHSSKEEPEHIILMTEKEFEKYNKRLYAIYERGFRIEIIR
ncbi:MAG: DEAD/DEAH box helicase [Candidatus Heimdallarchaeaceae archaeon]